MVWGPKQIQIKRLSNIKFHNFSRSTTFVLVLFPSDVVYKIWISNLRSSNVLFIDKMISNLKKSTTKLFNFWRSTIFILIFFLIGHSGSNIIHKSYRSHIYVLKLYWRAIDFVNKFTITLSKIKDLYKNCRSSEVTQLYRWKLFHLNLFSDSKLDLKLIFVKCQIFDTQQRGSLPSVKYLALGKLSFAECHISGTR